MVEKDNDEDLYTKIYKYFELATPTDNMFYKLSSLFTISSIIGNNTVLSTTYADIRPNLWVMFLGPSSISHKTTMLNMVTELINGSASYALISQDFSPEGLLQELYDTSNEGETSPYGVMIKDEFGGLLESLGKKEYMAGSKDLLMQLYDNSPNISRSLSKKKITLHYPYFCWLTATSAQRFTQTFNVGDLYTGFSARFLIAKYTDSNVIDHTTRNLRDIVSKRMGIIATLKTLRASLLDHSIRFELSNRSHDLYASHMQKYIDTIRDNEAALAIYSRINTNILKVAQILYFSKNYRDIINNNKNILNIELEDHYVKDSIKLMDDVLKGELDLILMIELLPSVRKLIMEIKKKGIISHSDLLWRSHMKATEFNEIIKTLLLSERITESFDDKTKKRYYTLSSYLSDDEAFKL